MAGWLSFRLGFHHFATAVKASRADVMAQMRLARGGFHRNAWYNQCVVRPVHTALGGRFFVLLDCHDELPESSVPLLVRDS